GTALPRFHLQAPLLSLPGILHTTIESVPSELPYVHAGAHLVDSWRHRVREMQRARSFLVGIAWQGSPKFRYDSLRSIPLAAFALLAEVPGVRLVSLQKNPGTDKPPFTLQCLPSTFDEKSGSFMDTAAIMRSLDLVITSDSAIAHLAGALAVPVWV